eukprot:620424-Prymnesium_polylepis.2
MGCGLACGPQASPARWWSPKSKTVGNWSHTLRRNGCERARSTHHGLSAASSSRACDARRSSSRVSRRPRTRTRYEVSTDHHHLRPAGCSHLGNTPGSDQPICSCTSRCGIWRRIASVAPCFRSCSSTDALWRSKCSWHVES